MSVLNLTALMATSDLKRPILADLLIQVRKTIVSMAIGSGQI